MSNGLVDFRLTQGAVNTQVLTLAEDPSYPSYHIRLHDSGEKFIPSLFNSTPDVSISHRNYLTSHFAEITFHKYRNSIGIKYPETALRNWDGDVTTTVEDCLPTTKQVITCESLGERRYALEIEASNGRREQYRWHPPRNGLDSHHMLELRKTEERAGGEEAVAKILRKNWDNTRDDLVAVVRVREDLMMNGQDDEKRGAVDQILVTAVALTERLRRRHRWANSAAGWY